MTQEEAIKFLSNTKVFVKDKGKEIQEKLFEIGFGWCAVPNREPKYLTKPFLYIYDTKSITCGNDVKFFYSHKHREISAEDILNIKVEYLTKTWEEFCKNNPIKEGEVTITTWSTISKLNPNRKRISTMDKCALLNSSAAEAHLALMQLHQLRDCYRGNVDPCECQYAIVRGLSGLIVVKDINAFLFFPTKKMAEEFLTNFKDLIEQAGDLI